MDAVALAREAQAARLDKLAPPPVVVMEVEEPEPEPEPGGDGGGGGAAPPPVRNMIAEIIESVIDGSSGQAEAERAQLALPPSIGANSIEETVSEAAARVAADLVTQASRGAAARVRREGGDWHPQIDAFWVDPGSDRTDPAAAAAVAAGGGGSGGSGPIRVDEEELESSRVWRAEVSGIAS
jgi:hypothetical protein